MTANEFISHYPRLYHVAESGSWSSIQKFGLESTSALLDRFSIAGQERDAIESTWRGAKVQLKHDQFGSIVIRDQTPISHTKLTQCLRDMTASEWYRMLNGYVFLWPSLQRRDRMLCSYQNQHHDVLTIDSKQLLAQYSDKMMLSPINSGSTLYNPALRGRDTFVPFDQCPFSEWLRRRRKRPEEVVAEVTLSYRISGIELVVQRVESYFGGELTGTIWEAPGVDERTWHKSPPNELR